MAVGQLMSIGEYLSPGYRPGCDSVDGAVLERNWGEYDHARLHGDVFACFLSRRKEWGIRPVVEPRVQVSPTRFGVSGVCVVIGEPSGQIFRTPPFICIGILSRDNRIAGMRERLEDYLRFGLRYVWILDPRSRKAYRCSWVGVTEVAELVTDNPAIAVPASAFFAE